MTEKTLIPPSPSEDDYVRLENVTVRYGREAAHAVHALDATNLRIGHGDSEILSAAEQSAVKPFKFQELLARIRALLRRTTQGSDLVLSFSDVEVDLDQRMVRRSGADTRMTRAEFNLLAFFLQNPGRALSRDVILNSVWGYESFPNTRTVDAHVVRLRQKLEPDPEIPRHFLTMHGVGYRFLP